MAATLKDIAEKVGLHPATVSRALNPRTAHLVSPASVAKVRKAASALDYVPNPMAAGLRTSRSHTIGLTQAQARSESIEGSSCEIFVPVTEEGALYGSVGTREISEAFIESGVEIDKSEVQLPDGPIKEQGEFNIVISVHPEVSANVVVKVSAE